MRCHMLCLGGMKQRVHDSLPTKWQGSRMERVVRYTGSFSCTQYRESLRYPPINTALPFPSHSTPSAPILDPPPEHSRKPRSQKQCRSSQQSAHGYPSPTMDIAKPRESNKKMLGQGGRKCKDDDRAPDASRFFFGARFRSRHGVRRRGLYTNRQMVEIWWCVILPARAGARGLYRGCRKWKSECAVFRRRCAWVRRLYDVEESSSPVCECANYAERLPLPE